MRYIFILLFLTFSASAGTSRTLDTFVQAIPDAYTGMHVVQFAQSRGWAFIDPAGPQVSDKELISGKSTIRMYGPTLSGTWYVYTMTSPTDFNLEKIQNGKRLTYKPDGTGHTRVLYFVQYNGDTDAIVFWKFD